MEQEHETYKFTYSAKQQEEIKQILQKYVPKEENKMEQLRRLDKAATDKGLICSLITGLTGILLLGGGMSIVMVWQNTILGIPLGILGIVITVAAYPLNSYIVKKQREKIAPQIISLSNALLNNTKD